MTGDPLNDLYQRAQKAHHAGRFEAARALGKEMEARAPKDPRTWVVLAQSALSRGDHTGAAKYLTALHQSDPNNLGYRRQLTGMLAQNGYFDEAMEMFRPVFQQSPESLEKYTYFGKICMFAGAEQEALKCFQKADTLSPGNPDIKTTLGEILITMGEVEKGQKEIETALQLNPRHLEGLALKAEFWDLSAPEMDFLESFSEDEKEHLGSRVDAAFVLAKAQKRKKAYKAAFAAYDRANALAGKFFGQHHIFYDDEEERRALEEARKTFKTGFWADLPAYPPAAVRPVFIIGLPRSGTTLVEQILGSHEAISPGGEFKTLGEVSVHLEALKTRTNSQSLYEVLRIHGPLMRQEYLKKLFSRKGRKAAFVTDKMPLNFKLTGLAHVLFPEAKFVFLTREPLANCLSMFFQPLNEGYPAATALETLGQYYLLFQDYLAVWRSLPEIEFYDLKYEDLAEKPEQEAKKLIDFLGLPWDEACLDFHNKATVVRTFSNLQVREPVSKKYIGRWKHYEAFLDPLKKALGLLD